ncbi:class I SAM-dependent methyltransferase [Sporohalobacter salinus]|uniref:class I SAM-dependent methyltransferase n=1 Tax=Sporohalobacter salinus TaxID=1494606 RepID=UPI0023BA7789|nr:class I SAM-dependent methyltransferase [Sporohalobacter salinus]MBM7623170.1 cyclopropane fatty-acyl-phospholipid synthase-like methyltransferase [Sporohalobacter salinus]
MVSTIDYYNKYAEKYYENTVKVDMTFIYQEFLAYVKEGGHILDLGCGSGRDSLYFLNYNYQVTAIDGSKELVRLSSQLLGQEVLHIKFSEVEFTSEFDGIWACASLLHVSKEKIESVLSRLAIALVKNGIMYISFKYGDQEIKRDDGRLFNYYDGNSFLKLKKKIKRLEIIKRWKTIDARKDKKDEYWFNVLLKKV